MRSDQPPSAPALRRTAALRAPALLRRANTDPLLAHQEPPSLRRANTDPLDAARLSVRRWNAAHADTQGAEQNARRRTHPESARTVDQDEVDQDAEFSSRPKSKFARCGALRRQNSLPAMLYDEGGMALMAGIMLEDAAWLDEHRARAKALENEHGRTRAAVELLSMDHDDSHEPGAAACAASALLAESTPKPERGADTEDYIFMSGTLHVASRARPASSGAISEFIDDEGSPAAVTRSLAMLCRATDVDSEVLFLGTTGRGHLPNAVNAMIASYDMV